MAGGLSLYAEGHSLLHRAHPLTKGVLTLSAIALAFTAPSATWVAGVLAVLLVLVAFAGVIRRLLAVAVAILLPITVLLFVVQGFANAHHVAALGQRIRRDQLGRRPGAEAVVAWRLRRG